MIQFVYCENNRLTNLYLVDIRRHFLRPHIAIKPAINSAVIICY